MEIRANGMENHMANGLFHLPLLGVTDAFDQLRNYVEWIQVAAKAAAACAYIQRLSEYTNTLEDLNWLLDDKEQLRGHEGFISALENIHDPFRRMSRYCQTRLLA